MMNSKDMKLAVIDRYVRTHKRTDRLADNVINGVATLLLRIRNHIAIGNRKIQWHNFKRGRVGNNF